MPNPIVIIHGWSDHAGSFVALQQALITRLQVPVTTISLAEWLSLDDFVTYDDLVTRLDSAWRAFGLPVAPGSVDVVVHSTGALLIRDWQLRNFPTPGTSPVKHFVMLAPANFGSPIAHKGVSFIGRVIKGWDAPKMFEVGALLLRGLELASPYTWKLAEIDWFAASPYFGANGILATVLVGNAGYSGIASAANEPGSDGTVRVSTANLNAARARIDLTDPANPMIAMGPAIASLAGFRVMDGLNHGTIHDPASPGVVDAVVAGLQVPDAGFAQYCADLTALTQPVLTARENQNDSYYWGYQNTVFLVKDQFETHVQDYFLEFFGPAADTFWENLFHQTVIEDIHPYRYDSAYRSVLINTTRLRREQAKLAGTPLQMSLTASPDFSNNQVGYATFRDQDIGAITIDQALFDQLFQPNRTLFVEVIIRRQQRPEIVQLGNTPPPHVQPVT